MISYIQSITSKFVSTDSNSQLLKTKKKKKEKKINKNKFRDLESFPRNSILVKIKPPNPAPVLINPNNEDGSPEVSRRKQTRLPKGLSKKGGASFRGAPASRFPGSAAVPPATKQLPRSGRFIGENSRVAIILGPNYCVAGRIKRIESLVLGPLVNGRRDHLHFS